MAEAAAAAAQAKPAPAKPAPAKTASKKKQGLDLTGARRRPSSINIWKQRKWSS